MIKNIVIILLLVFICGLFLKLNNKENFQTSKKIYVITPSLCRDKLIKTCNSIYKQKYKNWEHIILFDNVENFKINKFLKNCPYKPRIVKGKWNNYGNGQRYDAWNLVKKNSIITYIDDDDFYIDENVFNKINDKFSYNPNICVIFWQGMRFGNLFNNKPPQKNSTMSNQFAHLKFDNLKNPIRWEKCQKNNNKSGRDGDFINRLVQTYNYKYIDEPLVVVEKASKGE